jgi:hypothetical protein
MYYTYVTGPGASGAPVFDASSGNVVCFHVGSYTCLQFHVSPTGSNPEQLSLQPVAIGAVVEVTKRLKPSMERVT